MTIEVKNVAFSYEKDLILEDISLKIEQGEFIVIFGPNGGGKTTLLHLLMGFLQSNKGVISVFGQNPISMRKKMGYVPQMKNFDKQFPISVTEVVLQGYFDQISRFGRFKKKAKEKAKELLHQMGLQGKEGEAFATLSGGQMQKVLIARALISDPEILFLDEPTASIDVEAEKIIYRLLLALKKKITIIMVTHDLESILDKADRLFCIQRKLTAYSPQKVCEHFTLGLYHPPLTKKKKIQ
ncbi:MAG: metal ABC transporter ATP-binding protein [Chlamydiae bacterium]|nr:metal ABC transporter ATP-binding protein [Chlamydiota bacterium]